MILESIQKKILTKENLSSILYEWKTNHEKIVFTNGCFDLIHPGHIIYLAKAAETGTKLIIGLNSDASVRRLKGKNRPILDEQARALALAAMTFVDAVVFFDDDTPLSLIERIIPDILIKGGDYQIEQIVGYDVVVRNGGVVKVIDLVPDYSTSLIEKKILSK